MERVDMKQFDAIIFDIDGTLADCQHRQIWLNPTKGNKKDWDRFYLGCDLDLPIQPIIDIFNDYMDRKQKVFLFTGRREMIRVATKRWLNFHTNINWDCIQDLMMRPDGNTEPDDDLKYAMAQYHGLLHKNVLVYDDRDKVVKMWRERCGFTCLQVAPGDF